ncbi:MAG: hypothetical protein QM743_13030, partial [Chitinophagaceae bacterium]
GHKRDAKSRHGWQAKGRKRQVFFLKGSTVLVSKQSKFSWTECKMSLLQGQRTFVKKCLSHFWLKITSGARFKPQNGGIKHKKSQLKEADFF